MTSLVIDLEVFN